MLGKRKRGGDLTSVFGLGEDPVLGLFLAVFTFAIILIMLVRPNLPFRLPDGRTDQGYTNAIPNLLEGYRVALDTSRLPQGIRLVNDTLTGKPETANVPSPTRFRDFIIPAVLIPKEGSASALKTSKRQLATSFQLRLWKTVPIQTKEILPMVRAGHDFVGAVIAWGGSGRLKWEVTGNSIVATMLNQENGLMQGPIPIGTAPQGRPVPLLFRVKVEDVEAVMPPITNDMKILVLPRMQFFTTD